MPQQITIRVELGSYTLVGREVEHLEVQQAVGDHARCTLHFARDPAAVSSPVAALRIGELAEATLRVVLVADGGGQECLAFAGKVREAEIEHLATGAGNVTVYALSDSYMLGEHVDRRYFREHDAAALAKALDIHVANGVSGGAQRDYVQAGVSTWAFLAQVTAEEGLQLRPRWPRSPDGSSDSTAEIGRGFADETHALTWGRELLRLATALAPTNTGVTGAFYDPVAKHDHRFRGVRAQVAWLGGARPVVAAAREASTTDADGGDAGHLEPGRVSGVRARTLTEFRDRLELASARRLGSTVTARGKSTSPGLRAGDRVDVAAAAGLMGSGGGEVADRTGVFGLVSVTHRWTGTLYENDFVATPWADYHQDPVTVAPREGTTSSVGGLAVGVVVAVTDPKGLGRVRVRLAWMDESEHTAWVRVAGMGGGNGRGVGVLPSVGDEVVVGAINGDPEHLVILGGLWNGVDKAGHAPGRQHWVTPAGNTLSFVEGKAGADEEKVELYTKGGSAWVQLAAKGPGGVPLVTVRSAGDLSIEAPDGELRITAKSLLTHVTAAHATEAGGDYTLKAAGVTVDGGGRIAMKSGGEMALRSGGALRAHGGGGQTLTGSTMALNPPGATAPSVSSSVPAAAPTAWSPKGVPGPGPGRSTQDPKTPTRRELARKGKPTSSTSAGSTSSDIADPKWTQTDDGVVAPGPKGAGTPAETKLTAEQQKLRDVKSLLQQSATGRSALQALDANKVPVGFQAGGGSYWDGAKIVIDKTEGTQDAALTLVHEANHAVASLTGTTGNPLTQSRADYVSTMLNEEAVGTVRSIVTKRELVAAGVPVSATFPLEPEFDTAFKGAVSALTKSNPAVDAAAQTVAGDQAGLARVLQGFNAGEVVTSVDGQAYPQYYGGGWDAMHPPPKKVP